MIDAKLMRSDTDRVRAALARRGAADEVDAFLELDGKVAYAKKRWGCTLFYVDTNFFWRRYGPEQKWETGPIAPDVWKRLLAKYPDTLFIPEIADYRVAEAHLRYDPVSRREGTG